MKRAGAGLEKRASANRGAGSLVYLDFLTFALPPDAAAAAGSAAATELLPADPVCCVAFCALAALLCSTASMTPVLNFATVLANDIIRMRISGFINSSIDCSVMP